MQKKTLEFNTIISSVRSRVDRSLSLSLSTPELDPNEMAEIINLQGANLICLLTPLDEKDAPKYVIDKELEQKTPSTRLRGVLYVLWEQSGSKGNFDDFYRVKMEGIIEAVKNKLE